MPSSLLESSPSLCYDSGPYFRTSPNGDLGGGCEPDADLTGLAIGLIVFYAVTLVSSCALAYVVKSRRNGSCSQITCWFFIGLVFSVMAWYMLQCFGPKPRNPSHLPPAAALDPEHSLGTAPPASASVEAARLDGVARFQQQDNLQQSGGYIPPPPFNPFAFSTQAGAVYAPPQLQGHSMQI
jgi:hypothetical protein